MAKKPALGRGLSALIAADEIKIEGSSSISEIELSEISVNPDQPRRTFDEGALEELAASIAQIGVIQPITLRELEDGSYQIIAGERRYRASKKAGLRAVPAYIRKAEDEDVMEMALVENIQREDLNSIEIALAYQNLIESYNLTQEKLSERVGKRRATIANYLRLLKLPAEVQIGIKDQKLNMAHARTIVTLEDPAVQLALYELIVEEGLSVRRVEELVRALKNGAELADLLTEANQKSESPSKKTSLKKKAEKQEKPEAYTQMKEHLAEYFQTKVELSYSDNGKGKITIPFSSEADLDRIISMFDKIK